MAVSERLQDYDYDRLDRCFIVTVLEGLRFDRRDIILYFVRSSILDSNRNIMLFIFSVDFHIDRLCSV